MKTLSELQEQYYNDFKGLPSNGPIVRNGQVNDAFELVVLHVLYGKQLPPFIKENVLELSKYVVAPPDAGIDIFYQHENGDEYSFDVIQVKNTSLTDLQLKECITKMRRTIEDYCKNPELINSEPCKTILSESSLDKSNKSKCTYYVVHTGTAEDFSGSNENEKVITIKGLDILYKNISDYVDSDELIIKEIMTHEKVKENGGAYVCSLNGHDLAVLCNRYYSTQVGRNILFGNNLRESLITKKSKPFQAMSKTIIECPENFWYYNNGITIIAKDIEKKDRKTIELKSFSIVNGAQTTSALGLFLKEANKNNRTNEIKQLKKAYVLARILKVPDEKMREDIAIFNNTQNPITSRDMVANRPEQKHLNEWLLNDSLPKIFCEIRRGSRLPADFNKAYVHRKTTNEELAQLAYASFLQKPFIAKDKKSALFNYDYTQNDFVINEIYHNIFNWDEQEPENNGIIFKKSKAQIDELLFVRQLYKESKSLMKKRLEARIRELQEQNDNSADSNQISSNIERIKKYSLHLDTVGICMFYFIALYYEYKAQFSAVDGNKAFMIDKYYSDKNFREELVESASNLFLSNTISILVKTASDNQKAGNVNNWIRSASCETAFLNSLREAIVSDFYIEKRYKEFCKAFKA